VKRNTQVSQSKVEFDWFLHVNDDLVSFRRQAALARVRIFPFFPKPKRRIRYDSNGTSITEYAPSRTMRWNSSAGILMKLNL
jgi:hypothetical protein